MYDISKTAGTVVGIAGMGIGLGLLAGTARGVMNTMYRQPRTPYYKRESLRQPRRIYPTRPQYRRPQYGYWRG